MSLTKSVRRAWRRLLLAGPLVLFLSILPSFFYIDHWGEYLGYLSGHPAEESEAEHAAHAAHCHYGPATCSDQPAPIGNRVLPPIVELDVPLLATVQAGQPAPPLEGMAVTPPTDPPWT